MNPIKRKASILRISVTILSLTFFNNLLAITKLPAQVMITDAANAVIEGKTFVKLQQEVLKKHKIYVFENLSLIKHREDINDSDIKKMLAIDFPEAKTIIVSQYKNELMYTPIYDNYDSSQIDSIVEKSENSQNNLPQAKSNRHKAALAVSNKNTGTNKKFPFKTFYLNVKHIFGHSQACNTNQTN